jgi:hypothetical protein
VATIASLPSSVVTDSLTLPCDRKYSESAASPCMKMTSASP